jgi:hypothetical protein
MNSDLNTNSSSSDFILLIMNCQKYRYKAAFQKQTWLTSCSIPYFHIIGNIYLETDYMFDYINNILYVKVEDDYNSLPKKVIAAYTAIHKEYTYKYIFKTDDDQMLSSNNFLTIIQKIVLQSTNAIHYGGYIINVDKPYLSKYYTIHPELPVYLPVLQTKYCSGRFYLLSMEAICQLIKKTELICSEYLEDYAVGLYLDDSFKTNMIHIQTNKYFSDINI